MNTEDLIKDFNKKFESRLSTYLTKKDIRRIDNFLKNQIGKYIQDIEQLQKELFNYKKTKKARFIDLSTKEYHRSFIACAIGAKYKNVGTFGTTVGHISNFNNYLPLYRMLLKLGEIGKKSSLKEKNGRRNTVGRCAEVKASYSLFNKDKSTNFSQIEFTNAYRPRTLQIIERCNNCKSVFGNV
ncbi:hypothetical protein [Flavobacterium sp. HJSW_4]|uniref:hypothetical protein n=1 Tax=Flavobacterium sp. HJSW_4 TaxID=3344660 RepID=UPI0035F38218